eukprot:2490010-Pyramimonas_sp.AAC.1
MSESVLNMSNMCLLAETCLTRVLDIWKLFGNMLPPQPWEGYFNLQNRRCTGRGLNTNHCCEKQELKTNVTTVESATPTCRSTSLDTRPVRHWPYPIMGGSIRVLPTPG